MAADTSAQLRHYQQEALIRAREQNIVMVGSTGVGKTLVALELLKDSDNYKNNRRAFFLTPTRHLAEQQYDRIVRGTWLKAEMIVGGEVEIWSKRKWQAIMAANEVIVCTAQILVNLLQKGSEYMSFDRISLLIFDECHRAGKKHSYVGVMNFYDPASSKPLPKVFGMTATPTEECFQLLQSVPHVCPIDQTIAYAALASLSVLTYTPSVTAGSSWELEALKQEMVRVFPSPHDEESFRSDACSLEWVHDNCGLWFSMRFLLLFIEYFKATRPAATVRSPVGQAIQKLGRFLTNTLEKAVRLHEATHSDRVERLLTMLTQRKTDLKSFRALVFTQRRATCRVLFEYVNLTDAFYGRCGFAVGQAGSAGVAALGLADSTKALQAFAEGHKDVLIATDVLAEGIDVPACRMVVTFDEINNPRCFAQMRGRARQKDGEFIAMCDGYETRTKVLRLERDADCFRLGAPPREEDPNPEDRMLSQQYPEFTLKVPSTGATINLDNSVSYVTQICQLNKECKSYGLSPIFTVEGTSPPYRCKLTLPFVMDIEPITTAAFPSRVVCRAVAAYLACVQLYQKGMVDDSLNPKSEAIHLHVYEEFDPETAGRTYMDNVRVELRYDARHLGLPSLMKKTSTDHGHNGNKITLHAYRFRAAPRLCMLTRAELPMDGGWEEHLETLPTTVQATRLELDDAVTFHVLLFHQAIHIKRAFTESSSPFVRDPDALEALRAPDWDKGYLIAPLTPDGTQVAWDLVLDYVAEPDRVFEVEKGGIWPLPKGDPTELLIMPRERNSTKGNGRLYGVVSVCEDKTLGPERKRKMAARAAAAAARAAAARAKMEAALDAEDDSDSEEEFATSTRQPRAKPAYSLHVAGTGTEALSSDDDSLLPGRKKQRVGMVEEDLAKFEVDMMDIDWESEDEDDFEDEGYLEEKDEDLAAAGGECDGDMKGKRGRGGKFGDGKRFKRVWRMQSDEDREPTLHLSQYTKDTWDECDADQPLLLVERVLDTNHVFRAGNPQVEDQKERKQYRPRRLVAPQTCLLLRLPRDVFIGAQTVLPILWRVENGLKVRNLGKRMGIPIDIKKLTTAVSKPDYERFEFLGDSYLKWLVTHLIIMKEPFIEREGLMHTFRANMVCNLRLLRCAQRRRIDGCIILRKSIQSTLFQEWAPSLISPLSGPPRVHGKVVADVCEALLGACLVDKGPAAADAFLQWIGMPMPCRPECWAEPLPVAPLPGTNWPVVHKACVCWTPEALQRAAKVFPSSELQPAAGDMTKLARLEGLLGYTFKNKWLALQALTHPSYSKKTHSTTDARVSVHVKDYQRMEFLGDAAWDYCVIAHHFFKEGSGNKSVDELQAEKQQLVNNDHMAQVGVEVLKLHRFIDLDDVALAREIEEFVNRQPGKRGVNGPKPIADLFESLVAAVFIDAGGSLEVVHDVLLPRLSQVPPITGKEGESGDMDVDSTAPAAVGGAGPDGVCEGMTDLQKLHKMFPVTMSTCAVHYPKAVKSVIESWEEGLEEKKLQEEEEKEKLKPKPGRDERLGCA